MMKKRQSKAAIERLAKNSGFDFAMSMSALRSPGTQPKQRQSAIADQIAATYSRGKLAAALTALHAPAPGRPMS